VTGPVCGSYADLNDFQRILPQRCGEAVAADAPFPFCPDHDAQMLAADPTAYLRWAAVSAAHPVETRS
jgi:hypothetical protein